MSNDVLAAMPMWVTAFATELLSDPDLNASRAAEKVGRAGQAKELLADRRVQMAIASIGGELRESYRSMRHAAVGQLACMLTYDPADMFDKAGNMLQVGKMPDAVRLCIEGIETRTDGSHKVKLVRRLDIMRLFFEVFGDLESANVTSAAGTARIVFYGRGEQLESGDEDA